MKHHSNNLRFSAKLLFQFRVDLGINTGKRRLCEERIVTFLSRSAKHALSIAKRKGKQAEYNYENSDGNKVYFEFIGVMELLELGCECAADEDWYDICERLSPLERRARLIPLEDQLSAIRNQQTRTKRQK
jgi:Domain of unknown function (DUF4288)